MGIKAKNLTITVDNYLAICGKEDFTPREHVTLTLDTYQNPVTLQNPNCSNLKFDKATTVMHSSCKIFLNFKYFLLFQNYPIATNNNIINSPFSTNPNFILLRSTFRRAVFVYASAHFSAFLSFQFHAKKN